MANELDETKDEIRAEGRDVHVIDKQLPVTVDWRSTLFQVLLWVCGIIPGVIFAIMKIKARSYLQQLQQKLQHDASTIDNYLQNRVTILTNTASLLNKSIDLDKTTFAEIAKYRSGNFSDAERGEVAEKIAAAEKSINIALEAYPDLKAHADIQAAMQQNSYTQQEITAAREAYNDSVQVWNTAIYEWPTKRIVAAKAGYTTRIPFTVSQEIRETAEKKDFFA